MQSAVMTAERHLQMQVCPHHYMSAYDFFLNEWLADGVTLLDFETLGDYARDDHEFQEQARKEEKAAPGQALSEAKPGNGSDCPAVLQLRLADAKQRREYVNLLEKYLLGSSNWGLFLSL